MNLTQINFTLLRDALLGCMFGLLLGSLIGVFVGGVFCEVFDNTGNVLKTSKK